MTTYKNRRGWLIAFGIADILFGCLCLLGLLFTGLGSAAAAMNGQGTPLRFMVPGLVFCVLIPLVFFFFYRGSHVRATCEALDPKARWTDRCPAPVLALTVMLAYGAFSSLASIPIAFVPIFGHLLTGWPAAMILFLITVILFWLARSTYRLHKAGWVMTLFLTVLGVASTAVTFAKNDMMSMFEAMGMGGQEMEAMRAMDFSSWMGWYSAGLGLVFLVYTLGLGRYFTPHRSALPPQLSPP